SPGRTGIGANPCLRRTRAARALADAPAVEPFCCKVRRICESNQRSRVKKNFAIEEKRIVKIVLFVVLFSATLCAQAAPLPPSSPTQVVLNAKQQALWEKLTASIRQVDVELDGVLGVAIEDLTTGQKFSLREDEVFAQASSIKIAVLAELYRQDQQSAQGASGKAKLSDLYTVQASDLVPDSDIMGGLTPSVTKITNRDLATMMVAVSDNSATNVLIDRVGMENVNRMLDSLNLPHTRLRRKTMDIKA